MLYSSVAWLALLAFMSLLGIVSLLAIEAVRIRHHALTVPPPVHYFRPG